MSYTSRDAIKTAYDYLGLNSQLVETIEGTNGRGIVYTFNNENTVIYIYPISCKQNNRQNFFDTRDSGVKERRITWEYAKKNSFRYFCFGFNEEQERYKDYILSLESSEAAISNVSYRKAESSLTTGTQVNIPNDLIPNKKFERIKTAKGFYISVIKKENINEYMRLFDNRPYLQEEDEELIYDISEVNYKTGISPGKVRNRILFGAPGTGKSFRLNKEKDELLSDGGDYERVTFHPDYSYANFVGTYKPVPTKDEDGKDSITYEYVPGPFMRVYVNALKSGRTDNVKPHLLIIEEINRANCAAVFGDVFQLLDRDKNVSEYPIMTSKDMKEYLAKPDVLGGKPEDCDIIKIPDNMFIWSTMNSADQGVFPMDTAFKRRWDFTYLGIDDGETDMSETIKNKKYLIGMGTNARLVKWNDIRKAINDVLSSEAYNVNEDKLLGLYFISKSILEMEDDAEFTKVFKNKVLMYLFDDAAKQKKKTLFEKCKDEVKGVRYSDICKQFDTKGVFIFPEELSKRFTEKPSISEVTGENVE